MSMLRSVKLHLSFKGRLNRLSYFIGSVILYFIYYLVCSLIEVVGGVVSK